MTAKELEKILQTPKNTIKYHDQRKYFEGNNVAILNPLAKPDPDNRVTTPFVRRAVTLVKGYMAKPASIMYSGGGYETDIQEIYEDNDEQLETADALQNALIHGEVYELVWIEDGEIQFAIIPNTESYPIYSNSLKPKLKGFVRNYKIGQDEFATAYDDIFIEQWQKRNGAWTLLDSPQPHGFGVVPINIGHMSSDKRNLFDHALSLIDQHDKVISEDIANELERFASAYLLMRDTLDATKDEDGLSQVDKLKMYKTFDNLGDNVGSAVQFLQRAVDNGFIESSANRIERLIYESMMIFNPNDVNFATASGIAQAYKLLGFEYLCASIESYFGKFLYNRLYLVGAGIKALTGKTVDTQSIQISFKRNLPFDLAGNAVIASQLSGIWDLQSILDIFPDHILSSEAKKRIIEAKENMMELPDLTNDDERV